MKPRIEIIEAKKLIGMSLTMSLASNRTGELWRSFMPRRTEISARLNNNLIALQLYHHTHFSEFSPAREFTKWAAVEVSDFNDVPEGMQTLIVPSGQYAIFHYKGASNDTRIFDFIFREWLPSSPYQLDNRPHYEVLGEKYKNLDPSSEEEICIPIRQS
ncbi:MAG TPA: GyrI-like domain-containing protein [Chryseosolibacter sp.]